MSTVHLVVNQPAKYHVSLDTVEEFESTILTDPRVNRASVFPYHVWRLLGKADYRLNSIPSGLMRELLGGDYLVVLMTRNFSRCMPYFLSRGKKSVYMFDAWPKSHDAIRQFVTTWGVNHVFVSSSQATARLAKHETSCHFHWIPEGIDIALYKQYPYTDKHIDVLHLGRRYDLYHDLIAAVLRDRKKVYLYEKVKGEIIFPSRAEFIDGIARSKISICVPSSITHPDRAGDIETMTIRYLQSMVSKCLIVGHAPLEMINLFGYNPVVEIDIKHAGTQLEAILDSFEDYIPLIEKNYGKVHEHTWWRRWEDVARIILEN